MSSSSSSSNYQQNYLWEMNPNFSVANPGDDTRKYQNEYTQKEELGKGGFGIVTRCIHKGRNLELAAKINNAADKKRAQEDERDICMALSAHGHLNLVNLFDSITEGDVVYNMYELATGGDLMQEITRKEYLNIDEAAIAICQILDGVNHMHDRGYLHRDLKPHNVLVQYKGVQIYKIADFGLSCRRLLQGLAYVRHNHGRAGTVMYQPPEAINHNPYDTDFDIWSCGVILYQMLAGYAPFWETSNPDMLAKISAVDFEYANPEWSNMDEPKQMINVMIAALQNRFNYQQIVALPMYIRGRHQALTHPPKTNVLKQYIARKQLKKDLLRTEAARRAATQAQQAQQAGAAGGP
ncbi:calcium/calmodulin-dependent protein kinase type II alpha chain-like [Oppia nitens]|uniref:calcium/calmodulin-dependent protein kinase type II alpha chain-like n=1 Tax=Oppia nitens TaxID=1686743 RepID=UPI0023DC217D|nr:calcium/calmodulin-dependent protein kinase type II alpha chain-like [Oppia nitens]